MLPMENTNVNEAPFREVLADQDFSAIMDLTREEKRELLRMWFERKRL